MVKKQELVGCLIPLRAHLFYHPRKEWLNLAIGLREYVNEKGTKVTLRHKGVKRFLRVARLFSNLSRKGKGMTKRTFTSSEAHDLHPRDVIIPHFYFLRSSERTKF